MSKADSEIRIASGITSSLHAGVPYVYVAGDGTTHRVTRKDVESLTEDGEMSAYQAISALAIEIYKHREEE